MKQARHIARHMTGVVFLITLVSSATACRVWTDYSDVDSGPGGDACGFFCESTPWWNDDYTRRLEVRATMDIDGQNPVVLPLVLPAGTIDPSELREDLDDLRVVQNGAELAREVVENENGSLVVWIGFTRAPTPADALHLYWSHADATIPASPWDDHIAAFHFESDFETSVATGENFRAINDPTIHDEGRLGAAALVPPWPGSLRLYDAQVLVEGTMSFAFSFRGRYSDSSDRSVMRVRGSDQSCAVVEISHAATQETVLTWIDPTDCTGEADEEITVSVPVHLTDGAWHDVVASVDHTAGIIRLAVDDEEASESIAGGAPVSGRLDVRGGDSDDPPGYFLFDEVRSSIHPHTADEALLLNRAVRGEAFRIGAAEDF